MKKNAYKTVGLKKLTLTKETIINGGGQSPTHIDDWDTVYCTTSCGTCGCQV